MARCAKYRSLDNDNHVWIISSAHDVKSAVKSVANSIAKDGRKVIKRPTTKPFVYYYRPEMERSDELDANGRSCFQSQIGVVRWMVELGLVPLERMVK